MIKETIKLNCNNKLVDNPNNFIRLCYKLCNMFELNICSMEGFKYDDYDMSFDVKFTSPNILVWINYCYNDAVLHYEISSKYNEECIERYIEKYVKDGVAQVNYMFGEYVWDIWGKEYKVMEDTNIPKDDYWNKRSCDILVMDDSGETLKISSDIVSKI